MLALTLLAGCLSCAGRAPTAAEPPAGAVPGHRLFLRVTCEADRAAASIVCREEGAATAGGAPARALLGTGQVRLRSSGVAYSAADSVFRAEVTVQNQLDRAIGTADGVAATGIVVFHETGPVATSYESPGDTGTVRVRNADGAARFTAADQPYFRYDTILHPGEVSAARTWMWTIPPQVRTFAFTLRVLTVARGEPEVPAAAPDSVPPSLYDPANRVTDSPRMAGTFLRDVVVVEFRPDATREERQAAVDRVGGRVVGGFRIAGEAEGLYFVRLAPPTEATLWAALDVLRALPQVAAAEVELVEPSAPGFLRPVHGAGFDVPLATGSVGQTDQAAVGDSECGRCYENANGTAHVFGFVIYPYSYERMSCVLLNRCHGHSQDGSCAKYHVLCPDQAQLDRAADILAAAARQDRESVIQEVASALPALVRYDPATREVVLLDCGGAVHERFAVRRPIYLPAVAA